MIALIACRASSLDCNAYQGVNPLRGAKCPWQPLQSRLLGAQAINAIMHLPRFNLLKNGRVRLTHQNFYQI